MTSAAAVLMGRFQPFHNGHLALLNRTLELAPRAVVVLGSAGAAPSPRNPFSARLREEMIRSTMGPQEQDRILFVHQRDVWDAPRWAREVQTVVDRAVFGPKILVGFVKDASSSYLGTFREWTFVDAGRHGDIDATPLRQRILSFLPWEKVLEEIEPSVPEGVLSVLSQWAQGPEREDLAQDHQVIETYRKRWGAGPFVTVDALVRASGHILLITRGARPQRGTFALPGGFLEDGEHLVEGARRELLEETGLDLRDLEPVDKMVFSHPGRSERAHIITHAFVFEPPWETLPEVRGLDDAGSASWIPEDSLPAMEGRFFEDHAHLVRTLLARGEG